MQVKLRHHRRSGNGRKAKFSHLTGLLLLGMCAGMFSFICWRNSTSFSHNRSNSWKPKKQHLRSEANGGWSSQTSSTCSRNRTLSWFSCSFWRSTHFSNSSRVPRRPRMSCASFWILCWGRSKWREEGVRLRLRTARHGGSAGPRSYRQPTYPTCGVRNRVCSGSVGWFPPGHPWS